MLTLEIRPGSSLGPFQLGASLGESLHLSADYQRVEVKFSEEVRRGNAAGRTLFPLARDSSVHANYLVPRPPQRADLDIIIVFPENGFLLRFDSRTQVRPSASGSCL